VVRLGHLHAAIVFEVVVLGRANVVFGGADVVYVVLAGDGLAFLLGPSELIRLLHSDLEPMLLLRETPLQVQQALRVLGALILRHSKRVVVPLPNFPRRLMS